jgi:phospholipase C
MHKPAILRRLRRSTFSGPPPFPDKVVGVATTSQIRHVIVLTMSSHSYDNFLGMLQGKGDGLSLDEYGTPIARLKTVNGMTVPSHHLPSTFQQWGAVLDSWEANKIQANGKANDGFVRSVKS